MEKKEFKAESRRLLDLMVNSIYTHKEIFLRELISNASDACDKLCYRALTDQSVGMNRGDFEIRIELDPSARILTVSDNGIGMNQTDLEENLGVIASSGSYKFKQELAKNNGENNANNSGAGEKTENSAGENADKQDNGADENPGAENDDNNMETGENPDGPVDVIGQFGVGFYSVFMVADRVTVISRKYGEESAWKWESDGVDGYMIEEAQREKAGTDVILHIGKFRN